MKHCKTLLKVIIGIFAVFGFMTAVVIIYGWVVFQFLLFIQQSGGL